MDYTIILPIYGKSPWLNEAVQSVLDLENRDWKLVLADDGCDEEGRTWINKLLNELDDDRITWVQRPTNYGLFKNINNAIRDVDSDWVLLLCSDDKLEPNALNTLGKLNQKWSDAKLILSSFRSINEDGSLRPPDSASHHDQIQLNTGLVGPEKMLPALLRLGSLNGNLTGMAFSKKQWLKTGPFKDNWRHAADWEWLIRACESDAVLLNRSPIASIRTHNAQLSVQNRNSGHECQEVAAVVTTLLRHPLLKKENKRKEWAGHVMQYQLWNLLKAGNQWKLRQWSDSLLAIHRSAGLRQTTKSLLVWLPQRWKKRRKRNTP